MRTVAFLVLTVLGLGSHAGASVLSASADASANPIRKVVTLLQDMQAEITAEGEKEKELYDAYMCYCKTSTADLSKASDEASAKIADLEAKVESESAEKTSVDQELAGHKKDRSEAQNDMEKATGIRAKEAAEAADAAAESKANLAAMAGAIPALEKGMGAAALMQMPRMDRLKKLVASSQMGSTFDRENVVAFLEQRANGDYAPQSGQIVGILKTMEEEMQKTAEADASEEASAAAAFEDLKSAKTKEIQVASAAIESKTGRSGELAVLSAQSKNALEDTEKELADTQKYSVALKVSCEEQQKAWTARQSARAEEVSAISEAIAIMNDDDALDIFKKTLPSSAALIQVGKSGKILPRRVGFLQAQLTTKGEKGVHKAREILKSLALTYKNSGLELISFSLESKVRVASKNGVEVESAGVSQMIDGMVELLKKEGDDDEKQKSYCSSELDKAAEEKSSVAETVNSQAAGISELQDQVATLGDQASTLVLEMKALDASVAEASLQRKKEHAEYTEMQTLNEAALQLLDKAKQRLYKFYSPTLYKAPPKRELSMEDKMYAAAGRDEYVSPRDESEYIAGTTQLQHQYSGFVQVRSHAHRRVAPPPPPATFDAYTKKGEKSTGVLALMDMLVSDLKNDMGTAETEEKNAQKEYEDLMSDSSETRAQKAKSVTDKESSKATLEGKLMELKTSKALSEEQAEQVATLISNLHSSCDFILDNFDLRKEARTNEMESLKNAKAVLAGAQ